MWSVEDLRLLATLCEREALPRVDGPFNRPRLRRLRKELHQLADALTKAGGAS